MRRLWERVWGWLKPIWLTLRRPSVHYSLGFLTVGGFLAGIVFWGDFSKRLPGATPNTEVGRLNRSMNTMLGRIDRAFADRARTIDQMRRFVGDASHLTHRADTRVSELAYGEKRRLEVGLALASSPSLLLLDEPLAGMSPSERVETVKLLRSIAEGRTLIIIDHDMDSLFELAAHVTVLQEGRILAEGTPDEIKSNKAVQEAYLGGMHSVGQS